MPEVQATTDLKASVPDAVKINGVVETFANATISPLIQEQIAAPKVSADSVFDSIEFVKDFLWAGPLYQRILDIEQTLIQAKYNPAEPELAATSRLIKMAMDSAESMTTSKLLDCWRISCQQLENESSNMQLPLVAMRNADLYQEFGLFQNAVINNLSNQTTLNRLPKIELPLLNRLSLFVHNDGPEWAKYLVMTSAIGGIYFLNSGDPKYFGIIAATSLAIRTLFSVQLNKNYFSLDRAVCEESNSYYQPSIESSAAYVPLDTFAKNIYQGTQIYTSAEDFLALRINRLLDNKTHSETDSSDYIRFRAYQSLAQAPFEFNESLGYLFFDTPDRYQNIRQALLSLDRIEFEWLKYQGQRFKELLSANICLQAGQ